MNNQLIVTGFLTRFGATYSCGAYGAGTYNESAACGSTTSTNGGLAGTGENIAIGLGGGVLLIVVAVVIFIRLHRKKAS